MAMDMNAAIRISAKVTGTTEVDRMRKSMAALEGSVGTLRRVLAGLGVAFTAQQFGGWIKGAVDTADHLNDLRQTTGVAVEDLSALALTAEQSGTSLDAVASKVGTLAKTMSDAANGNAQATAALKTFGISLSDLRDGSLTTTEALARISDRVAEMPDGLAKVATVQRVLGKSSADMIPFLNGGGEAIRRNRDELAQYGALISGEFAAKADEFNDKMALLGHVFKGFAVTIAEATLPAITSLGEGLLTAANNSNDLSDDHALRDWAEGAALGIAAMVDALSLAVRGIAHVGVTARSTFADMSYFKEYFTTSWEDPNRDTKLAKMWQDRMDAMEAVRQSLASLSNGDNNAVYNAVEAALKRNKWDAAGLVSGIDKALGVGAKSTGGGGFDDSGAIDRGNKALAERTRLLEEQANQIYDMRASETEAIELLKLEGQAINMSAFEYQQLVDAKKHEFEVSRATAEMLPETAALYKEVADGIFATRQQVERLNEEQKNTIAYGAKSALKEYAESATDAAGMVNQTVTDAFGGMEDALVDFVRTGKLNFSDLVDSMIADLARLAIKQAILGPLAKAIGGAIDITPNANGGVMTESGPMPLRTYSTGGIARTPQLALFGEGSMPEAYVPLPDGRSIPVSMKGGGGSNVQVVVNNHSGQQVQTNESTDGRGNRRVEVTIGDLVAQEIRRPGSSANLAIRQSFNSRQSLTGR